MLSSFVRHLDSKLIYCSGFVLADLFFFCCLLPIQELAFELLFLFVLELWNHWNITGGFWWVKHEMPVSIPCSEFFLACFCSSNLSVWKSETMDMETEKKPQETLWTGEKWLCSSEHVLLSICGVGAVHLDGKMLLLVLKGVQVKFDQNGDAGFCVLQNYVKPGF